MRLLRWEGHPSPYDDPEVRKRLVAGSLRPDDLARIDRIEKARIVVRPGHSEFVVGPAHGFSRTYVWGPHVFEVWVEDADAERLLRHPYDRAMFRDVTEGADAPHPRPALVPARS